MVDSVVKVVHVDTLPANNFLPQSFYLNKASGATYYQLYLADAAGAVASKFTDIFQQATSTENGLMSKTDKIKLDGIANGANNYTHPTGDGNLHMPPTGTTSNGMFLVAGSAAGSTSWRKIVGTDIPTLNQDTTGNATTATRLQTARTIGGVLFDGTSNINLPGVNTVGNQNTTGNAATANKLTVARSIGGVLFDGTANIDLPGVNIAGNQNTTGNASTASLATNAVTLQTARTINGTNFNGSVNITTTLWGTARTLSWSGDVTGTGSVNGSANVTFAMTLADSGVTAGTYRAYAVNSKGLATRGVVWDKDGLIVSDTAGNTANAATGNTNTWLNLVETFDGTTSTGKSSIRVTGAGSVTVSATGGIITINGSQNITGNAATATLAAAATKLETARTIGGVSFDGTANINLPGVNVAGSQNTSGNAATATLAVNATTLQNARTINGTSFNGSANITTALWGTARTITLGAAAKTVDGSANVAWTVAEMGAVDLGGVQTLSNKTLSNYTRDGTVSNPATNGTFTIGAASPPITDITQNGTLNIVVDMPYGVTRTLMINPNYQATNWPSTLTWAGSGSKPTLRSDAWNIIVITGTPGTNAGFASYLGSK